MVVFPNRDAFLSNGLFEVSIEDLDHANCDICMSAYLAESPDNPSIYETPMLLPCGHVMGSSCLLRWTMMGNTCPFCRHVLYGATPFANTGQFHEELDFFDIPDWHPGDMDSFSAPFLQMMELEVSTDWSQLRYEEEQRHQEAALGRWNTFSHAGRVDEELETAPLAQSPIDQSILDTSVELDILLEQAIADSEDLFCEMKQLHWNWMNEFNVDKYDMED